MTPVPSTRIRLLLPLLAVLTAACTSEPSDPPDADVAGPFTPAEAQALRARWDYVGGWFGGDLMRFGHLNVDALFPVAALGAGSGIRSLPEAPRADVAGHVVETRDRGAVPLDDYVSNDPRIDGFLVLHRGEIVYERYPNMDARDRHLWFSVSKLVAGLVVSQLEDEGLLDPSRTVDHYVPKLAASAWAGVTIRNVLDMASGTGCVESAEAYADPDSCMLLMERSVGMQPGRPTVSFRDHVADMPRAGAQGERYEYASANTSVLMLVAEEVTGRTWPELISDRVWRHVGAESEPLMISGDYALGEAAAAHAGLFTTLRDLGRFGLHLLEQESFHGKLLADGRPELFGDSFFDAAWATAGDLPVHAAWQTDVVFADGDFGKGGWGGQFLYVSPDRDLVIAWFGTFGEDMVEPDLPSVARQLAHSDLWSS